MEPNIKIKEKYEWMSTSCLIGIINKDHSVESIFCQNEGYIDAVGTILYDYYFKEERVRKLLQLGNISYLCRNLEPKDGEEHSFLSPVENVTVAYMRDRGEVRQEARLFKSIEDFSNYYMANWCDCVYLFDACKNDWKYCKGYMDSDKSLESLEKVIEEKQIKEQMKGIRLL